MNRVNSRNYLVVMMTVL